MRSIPAALLACGLCPGTTFGQGSTESTYHYPVQAELLSWVSARYLHPGSPVFVKVVREWSAFGCFFPSGQTLEAKVMLASPFRKHGDESRLALSFAKIPCARGKSTIDLVLGAVAWNSGGPPQAQFPLVRYSMARTGGVSTIQGSFLVNGLELNALNAKGSNHGQLRPGDVIGIKDVALHMGGGPERSSLLTSSKRDVYLEKESFFVLVPASVAFSPPSEIASEVSPPASDASPKREETDGSSGSSGADSPPLEGRASATSATDFQPCEPPACATDIPSTGDAGGVSASSIPVGPLGYAPRRQREMEDLDSDDALAWLGPHELLVAFNPHALIVRQGAHGTGAVMRRIHAVVLDPLSQKVTSTGDWELPDRGEYLWQLSQNRVLVHAGSELRLYSAGLKLDARIPLDGPLAFVRTSPNGELMAIAVLKERHSPEEHTRLSENLDREPEEDVEIRILDKNLRTLAQTTSSSEIMPPILLNEGQVQLLDQAKMHYRLVMMPWKGDALTVARFASSCLPAVSSFAPDLLFVRTCSVDSGSHEYRVIKPHGGVLMRGRSDPQDLGQEAIGNGQNFAVRVLHANRAVVKGSVFRGTDLDFQELRIYRGEDGKRLAAMRLGSPPPAHGGFALLSDGSQLAVLSGNEIHLIAVPSQ